MSKAFANDILIGEPKIYLGDELIGTLGQTLTLSGTYDEATAESAHLNGPVAMMRVAENLTVTGELRSMMIPTLRRILGQASSLETATTLAAATTAGVGRKSEVQQAATAGTSVTLTETSSVSIVDIRDSDRSYVTGTVLDDHYAKGTDWTSSSGATNQWRKISAGSLPGSTNMLVSYDYTPSGSKTIQFGGETQPFEALVVIAGLYSDGGAFTMRIHRGVLTGGFEIPLDKKDFSSHSFTITALADGTKARGNQLATFILDH